MVALLAAAHLVREPGAAIIHDPRVIWAVADAIARNGGRSVLAPTGHIFLKAAMRREGAVYGGEMSAHHYFRGFMACDSGMIPWLMVAALLSRSGQSLTDLVGAMRRDFPSSGEINFRVADVPAVVTRVEAELAPKALRLDRTDGLSLDFGDWRLNLRASNTEPLLRLNVEARGRRRSGGRGRGAGAGADRRLTPARFGMPSGRHGSSGLAQHRPAAPEDRDRRQIVSKRLQPGFALLEPGDFDPDFSEFVSESKAGSGHRGPPLFFMVSIDSKS